MDRHPADARFPACLFAIVLEVRLSAVCVPCRPNGKLAARSAAGQVRDPSLYLAADSSVKTTAVKDDLQTDRVVLAGASGTIGRAVAHALIAAGRPPLCLMRANSSGESAAQELEQAGAQIVFCDLSKPAKVKAAMAGHAIGTVISCIASRSGSPRDAQAVDYQANANLLAAVQGMGAGHFILLSAICVQKPLLAFQHAKLAFEADLRNARLDYTVIRPTAFFKSLSGQVERVRKGKSFLLFGDGELTRCKPISDADLARFIARAVTDPALRNRIVPIGGPGPAISPREQGAMLFELTGRPPRYRSISPDLFKAAARLLSLGAGVSQWCAEKAEYARIARYYATESMLVLDPETGAYCEDATPEFGEETLRDHYARLIANPAGSP